MVDSSYSSIVGFLESNIQKAIQNEKENKEEDLYFLESYIELVMEILIKH